MTLVAKLVRLNWGLVLLLAMIVAIGIAMLYSAAGGEWRPWAGRQAGRFFAAIAIMIVVALVDIRFWYRCSYWAYLAALALVAAVEHVGSPVMGAQRWIDVGFFQLQPAELMKIALVIGLARYFHGATLEDVRRPTYLILPIVMVLVPAALVMRQPDLGTATMLVLIGAAMFFLANVPLWFFGAGAALSLAALPVAWSMLHDYQKKRILTFLDPESDPLGAGYHILQSKIALGSGGLFGKGFLKGTQSHLNFVPEKQTDFIFSMLAEELGLIGGVALVTLYVLVLTYAAAICLSVQNQFGRLLGLGIAATVFIYMFINIAMVMGLIPVVGVPLPLISYGGTAMVSILIGFGLVMSAAVHRDAHISRYGSGEE